MTAFQRQMLYLGRPQDRTGSSLGDWLSRWGRVARFVSINASSNPPGTRVACCRENALVLYLGSHCVGLGQTMTKCGTSLLTRLWRLLTNKRHEREVSTGARNSHTGEIRLGKFALSGNQRQNKREGDPHQVLAPPGTPVRSSRETLSAVPHGGNHATCYKSAEPTADASSRETRPTHCLPNAVAPQDRTASPRDWLNFPQNSK